MAGYRVLVRRRGKTEKRSYATLEEALGALESRLRELTAELRPHTERGLGRDYDPQAQVALRGELRGPRGLAAGVDVRGDGSAEAFTGRVMRQLVDLQGREDAYTALRRAVGG